MSSLVIGYGNDLRSDDGAGRVVADRVEALGLPDVRVRSVSQLTPELALDITDADLVVFVDASVDVSTTTVSVVAASQQGPSAINHYAEPAALLGMSEAIGRSPTKAYAVAIPVMDLEVGLELSPLTELEVDQAIGIVTRLVAE